MKMNLCIIVLSIGYVFSGVCKASTFRFPSHASSSTGDSFSVVHKKRKTVISMNLKELSMKASKNQKFKDLVFKGFENTKEEGLPEIPYKNILVSGDYKDIKINHILSKSYKFKDVLPVPAKVFPCRCEKDKKINNSFLKAKYFSRNNKFFKVTPLGGFRGESLFVVTFYLAMVDVENGLEVFPNIQFEISSKTHKKIRIINNIKDSMNIGKDGINKHMAVVGTKDLIESSSEYLLWKMENGYIVHKYYLEDIGNSFFKINNFFKEIFRDLKMSYVLILGDEKTFPTDYMSTSNHPRTPTDLSYFLMDGEEDRIPDVFYGRIAANNRQDLKRQLSKIMYFEKQTNYNKNIIGIASDEGTNPTDVEYMDMMTTSLVLKLGMREDVFLQDNVQSNPGNLNRALSRGALWLNYIGHGSGSTWPSLYSGEYSTLHVDEINIQKTMPIIIDVACQNGRFSQDNRLGMKFMNTTLAGGHKGATAYYGGSVDISWHPPAIMAVGINEHLSSKNVHTLGEVLLLGQLHLISNYDDTDASTENLIWYNLLGDPSTSLAHFTK